MDTTKNKKTSNEILKSLDNLRKKDFNFISGRIIGSMCTQPLPIAKKAYFKFLETNLGDPELFAGTKIIEKKYLDFLFKILKAPKNASGIIGSGGTESNITAIWLAKKLSGKKEIIIPKSAHFSFNKIASLMDIKLKPIKLDRNYTIDINSVRKNITSETCAIIGIAGTTELGKIDPIPELSDICIDNNLFLHVDAAFGGYIIPFLRKKNLELPNFDFKLKGVNSITIDAHKMGCSAIPLGTLVIRDKIWLEQISVETPYLSCEKQAGILATRSGGPVAAAYAVSEKLGFIGYEKIVETCMKNTRYLENKLTKQGFELITEPDMNVLAIKLKNPTRIADILTKKGWKINIMKRLSAIRLVIMPHVTRKTLKDFIPIFIETCKENDEI